MTQQFTSKEVNVPIGIEYALVDGNGLVIATVMWLEDYETGLLKSQIYAPNKDAAQKIPQITPRLGEWYKQRVRSDVLVEYGEVNPQGAYRIDYRNAGQPNSYRITLADMPKGIACLKPATVYRLRRDGVRRLSFNDLKALLSRPDAMIMDVPSNPELVSEGTEEVMRVLLGRMGHELVVWDEAAQYRARPSFRR